MGRKPPSRVRYERKHPMVSARLDKDTYKKLRKIVKSEKKSLAGFLKDFVRNKEEKWNGAYRRGWNECLEENQVWYYCSKCSKKIYMEPNSDSHKKMIEYMKEHGWGHTECIDRSK